MSSRPSLDVANAGRACRHVPLGSCFEIQRDCFLVSDGLPYALAHAAGWRQTDEFPSLRLHYRAFFRLRIRKLVSKAFERVMGYSPRRYAREWAAQIYSPFLSSISQVRLHLPEDRPISMLTSALNAREVGEGSNLALLEASSYGDFLFRERLRDVWIANPIAVYLDLLQSEGRAKEMAEHLRRERIGF